MTLDCVCVLSVVTLFNIYDLLLLRCMKQGISYFEKRIKEQSFKTSMCFYFKTASTTAVVLDFIQKQAY